MGKRIVFFFYYFLFWVLYFVLTKVVFLLYHSGNSFEYTWFNWLQTIYYGLSMDFSASATLCIIPAFMLLFTTHIRGGRVSSVVINIYTSILLLVLSALLVLDMELYQQNEGRIQQAILAAFNNTDSISFLAGLEMTNWVKNIIVFLLICVVFIAYYFESVGAIIAYFKKANILAVFFLLLLAAGLYFPIKYGIKIVPLNSNISHSESRFLNDATLNPSWELGKAIFDGFNENP